MRIRDKRGKTILINQKITILDLTNDGVIRLGLCVISYPTAEKPGNAYLKLNDNSVVWQYIPSTDKFVEVKTQKLTSKAMTILKRYPIHSMICSMTKTNNRNAREQG